MELREFLALPHLFEWGGVVGDDCTTWCASWVRERIGIDPAASLRGTYSTELGAHRILKQAGGLVAFIDSHLLPLGFARTDTPSVGDIGVVRPDGQPTEIAAINFSKTWAMLSPGRVVAKRAELVTAWRFPS
ncbi:DUF6950 family protein [Pararhizobium sp. O133]|uniref:DUF6950 family protein n=1 Tax=Pararhizobium sp. O133 TaxID=3449278 RepID=UPI003F687C00